MASQVIPINSEVADNFTTTPETSRADNDGIAMAMTMMALQTTIDINELFKIFSRHLQTSVNFNTLTFRNSPQHIVITEGQYPGRHHGNYHLEVMQEALGDATITRDRIFSPKEVETIENYLASLLYPLRNSLLYHQALHAATRDPLTGIGNRRSMEESIDREIYRCQRQGNPFSILVVDLDHFKHVNDTYGHAAGDAVLREAVVRIDSQLRTTDQLFRFGGEEFLVTLPNTCENDAQMVAERIRKEIASGAIQAQGESILVTASIGATRFNFWDDKLTLFNRADKALYQAKSNGRNQVVYRD